MAIQFGNDKIKEIYVGSDKIKEVYYGSELVWSGGLTLFKSNRVNAGFEFHRQSGESSDYYIGNDKIELSYAGPNPSIVVGLIDTMDITQFSHMLLEYSITSTNGGSRHSIDVGFGLVVNKTIPSDGRWHNVKKYVAEDVEASLYDSMLVDLSNFENYQGSIDMGSCYIFVQLQSTYTTKYGEARLEITKIELK